MIQECAEQNQVAKDELLPQGNDIDLQCSDWMESSEQLKLNLETSLVVL